MNWIEGKDERVGECGGGVGHAAGAPTASGAMSEHGAEKGQKSELDKEVRKPRLEDALGAVLSQLECRVEAAEGERAMNLHDSPEDKKLAETFKAMDPTLDALFAVSPNPEPYNLNPKP